LSSTNEFAVALLAILLGLASLPLFQLRASSVTTFGTTTLRITAFIALYIGGHAAASKLMPSTIVAPNPLALALVGLAFVALFALKTILRFRPEGRLAQTLYPWLFAGLYLDERFTRLTFRVWPPRFQLQRPLAIPESMNLRDSLEVRT
jgi:NAD(P)H-quinone oxidoreductase subunit 5